MATRSPASERNSRIQAANLARMAARRASKSTSRRGSKVTISTGKKSSSSRSGSSGVSTQGNAIPEVTTRLTDKGIAVSVNTQDAVLKELALQKAQKEAELQQQTILMGARRESAQKSAELQRQALQLQIEQRGVNIGRETARLNREARLAQSTVLSGAAEAGVANTSARKGAQIALRSGLTRETDNLAADELMNQRGDVIRRQEIEGNLQSAIDSAQNPVNVFLDDGTGGTTGNTGSVADNKNNGAIIPGRPVATNPTTGITGTPIGGMGIGQFERNQLDAIKRNRTTPTTGGTMRLLS